MEERSSSSCDGSGDQQKVEEIVLLPGFRFHPTDEELVGFYLKRKIQQRPFSVELIKQLDIYKFDPWDLPKFASTAGEKEWYFYCPRDRKYRNSARPNRVTGAGFWKATGTDRPIYSSSSPSVVDHEKSNKCIIGLKKSLVFYKGRAAKGTKTDWMMHEFRLPSVNDMLHHTKRSMDDANNQLAPATPTDSWAICRIFKKTSSITHRAISHSWVSPSSPLLNNHTTPTPADHHFNNSAEEIINNTASSSSLNTTSSYTNMMMTTSNIEMTSLPLNDHYPPNSFPSPNYYKPPVYPNNKQLPTYQVFTPPSLAIPTSYSLPPLEVVPDQQTKCNIPFFNMLSSNPVPGYLTKRPCEGGDDDDNHYGFSGGLPSEVQVESNNHGVDLQEDVNLSFLRNLQQQQQGNEMNNNNNPSVDHDQYWGALQSIESPTKPLSMTSEVATKLPSLWDSCFSNYHPSHHELTTLASLFC